MVKYILEEVDVDFGDVLYQEEFTRKRDAYRALERYIRQARKRGWDCDIAPVADYYAYECFKEVMTTYTVDC